MRWIIPTVGISSSPNRQILNTPCGVKVKTHRNRAPRAMITKVGTVARRVSPLASRSFHRMWAMSSQTTHKRLHKSLEMKSESLPSQQAERKRRPGDPPFPWHSQHQARSGCSISNRVMLVPRTRCTEWTKASLWQGKCVRWTTPDELPRNHHPTPSSLKLDAHFVRCLFFFYFIFFNIKRGCERSEPWSRREQEF